MQAYAEHRQWRDAAPAIQVPLCADVFNFGAEYQFEHGARLAAVETLRQLQYGLRIPCLSVSRTKDGEVERLLLDLLADEHCAQKCPRCCRADVDRFARTIFL